MRKTIIGLLIAVFGTATLGAVASGSHEIIWPTAANKQWPGFCVGGDKQAVKVWVDENYTGSKEVECGSIYAGPWSSDAENWTADTCWGCSGPATIGEIDNKHDKVTSVIVFNRTKASNYPGVCFEFTRDEWFEGARSRWWVEGKPDGSRYRWEAVWLLKPGANDNWDSVIVYPPTDPDWDTKAECLAEGIGFEYWHRDFKVNGVEW